MNSVYICTSPEKVWLYEKIFGLAYLFHIVLKSHILLRQVISLKKMVVLSVNFTILILWSPVSFNSFIRINEIGKYHSHNIMYNSVESRHPWPTNIRIKGSDRPFILI